MPGSYVLCDQLASLRFHYYQADDTTAATSAANVAFVSVELVLGSGSSTYAQRTQVALRNGL